MSLLREYWSFLLGFFCIIGGFLAFASIGFVTSMYGSDITYHYVLVGMGGILIFLGVVFMYLFIRK